MLFAALLVAIAIALTSGESHTPAELSLQRSQLVLVSHQLLALEVPVRREATAARAVWPHLARGMPAHLSASIAAEVSAAKQAAASIPAPAFLTVRHELTGPAERIASLFQSFSLLTHGGFSHLAQTAASLRKGPRQVAAFERASAGLYIDSIYDGNFDASLIGERVMNSYKRLGAEHAFAAALTPAQVSSIAAAYAPQIELLSPHLWRELLAQR